jgi:dihydrofolate reductase
MIMGIVTADMSMSLDGYIAGPKDDGNPGGELEALDTLHAWMFPPHGDFEQIARERFENVGAVVLGRRMFDLGEPFWGEDPSFHAPVFVLTHRAKDPLARKGGTTYFFVTDGMQRALAQAREAAGERNVMVMGGANALQQFLKAGLLDELLLHLVPVLIGEGIRLFENTGVEPIALEQMSMTETAGVTHLRFRAGRRNQND